MNRGARRKRARYCFPMDPTRLGNDELVAFIDESYREDHYYVGAVVCAGANLSELGQRFNAIRQECERKYGIDAQTVEFHAHDLMQGRRDWATIRDQTGEALWVYRQVVRAIVATKSRILIEGVDVRRLHARYAYPDPPHEVALRHLLERIDARCAVVGKTAHVECDIVDKQNELTRVFQRFASTGTPGYRSSRLPCIHQPLAFVDSRTSDGVQAADMAVYLYRRAKEEHNGHVRAAKATTRLMSTLQPAIAHERKWCP